MSETRRNSLPLKAILNHLALIDKHKLTQIQLRVLLLCIMDAHRITDIADKLKISIAGVCYIATKFEKIGYLKRIPNREDKRSVLLTGTKAGRRFCEEFS